MNTLNGIIANNNLMIVKDSLDNILYKLLKQPNPNKPLIKQLQDDRERLDESYLYFGTVREVQKITEQRNKYLEGMLISNTSYTKDLKLEIKDLEQQLKQLKQNLEL